MTGETLTIPARTRAGPDMMRLDEAIAIELVFKDAPSALTPEAQTVVEHARTVIAKHAQGAFERHCDRQRWCIQSDATLCTYPDCECPPRRREHSMIETLGELQRHVQEIRARRTVELGIATAADINELLGIIECLIAHVKGETDITVEDQGGVFDK